MQVTVNGEKRTLSFPGAPAPQATVAQLIGLLGLPASRVAIEHNGNIVPRGARETTPVQPGDVFEIVTLVGGG